MEREKLSLFYFADFLMSFYFELNPFHLLFFKPSTSPRTLKKRGVVPQNFFLKKHGFLSYITYLPPLPPPVKMLT